LCFFFPFGWASNSGPCTCMLIKHSTTELYPQSSKELWLYLWFTNFQCQSLSFIPR
jgi:hypothetical protein